MMERTMDKSICVIRIHMYMYMYRYVFGIFFNCVAPPRFVTKVYVHSPFRQNNSNLSCVSHFRERVAELVITRTPKSLPRSTQSLYAELHSKAPYF